MKRLKRFLLTGLVVSLLSGCSEEAGQEFILDQTIPEAPTANSSLAPAVKDASVLRGTIDSGAGFGWDESDEVNVYTLKSVKYNIYSITSGVGTSNAVFTRSNGTEEFEDAGTLYALTSCKYLYSFSATLKGVAKASVSIPNDYDISEVGAPEGCSRMPVPCWGIATFGMDGKLEANFQGMTALLKIDTATLPEGTQAVVLTTKRIGYIGEDMLEPGMGEPLSGTFDTELKDGAGLAANPIFYANDTLRVNLNTNLYGDSNPEEKYREIFIPVVPQTYTKLHVLAITGDSYEYHDSPHHWEGKVLKTFNASTPFSPNTIVVVEPQSTAIHTPKI